MSWQVSGEQSNRYTSETYNEYRQFTKQIDFSGGVGSMKLCALSTDI